MAVPDFQSIMLPLLRFAGDGAEHAIREAYAWVAEEFDLSDAERKELLPSGKMLVLTNRVQWAKTYLIKAGMLDSPRRGSVQITDRGREVLARGLDHLDIGFLNQYPEFVEFRTKGKDDDGSDSGDDGRESGNGQQKQTPDELLERAYAQLRNALAVDLLEQVGNASPAFFEKLVVDLLVAMGYGGTIEDAGQVVGKSGDEGIDGIIKEDRLGLDVIYLQAKRWEPVVGRPEIQKFVGALQGQRARKGIFVTTSKFSREAEQYVTGIDSKVVLIDGRRLAQLMIDFDIGVSPVTTYTTKRLDTDYFIED
jgi:restriction system protein